MDANTEVALKTAEMLFKMFNDYSQIDAALSSARLTAGASVVVAVFTLVGNYFINVRSKKLDYRDDYYKKIIDMRIGLINENSQAAKNEIIYEALSKVALKKGFEVYNYGMENAEDEQLTYVQIGLLGAILLNSGAVDFIVT